MKVKEIRGFENNTDKKYSVIWFVLEDFPNSVFGLKYFPNSEFKKDYIVSESFEDYYKQLYKCQDKRVHF